MYVVNSTCSYAACCFHLADFSGMHEFTEQDATRLREVETWIFDLDNTLYRATPEIISQTDELMGSFISSFLGVDREEARRVQKAYFRSYGLTLRGLMLRHGLDPMEYRDHLAQLNLSQLQPDPGLAGLLLRLPGRRIVYTNAFRRHADTVLALLGLSEHFEAVFDISDAGYVPKPAIESYRLLCTRYGVEPGRAAMVEDIAGNLRPAATLGMATVWVRTKTSWARDVRDTDHIGFVTDDLKLWLRDAVATLTDEST